MHAQRGLALYVSVIITILLCYSLSAGIYSNQEAILYSMSVNDTYISGGMFDKEMERNTVDGGKYDSSIS